MDWQIYSVQLDEDKGKKQQLQYYGGSLGCQIRKMTNSSSR